MLSQISTLLYEADYILIFLLNIGLSLFIFKLIQKKNQLLLPLILLYTIILAILLIISIYVIPNYPYAYIEGEYIGWLKMNSHPSANIVLFMLFFSTGAIILEMKFFAKLNYVANKRSGNFIFKLGVCLFISVLLAQQLIKSAIVTGWIHHMPLLGVLIGITGFISFNLYLHQNETFNEKYLTKVTTHKGTGLLALLKKSLTSDFLPLTASLLGLLLSFLLMSAHMSRRRNSLLTGNLMFNSLFSLIGLILIYFLLYKKPRKDIVKYAIQIIFSLIVMIIAFSLLNQIIWDKTELEHPELYDFATGLIFSISLFNLILYSIERTRKIGGSSLFTDILWVGTPFIISLIEDLGYGAINEESTQFNQIIYTFGIVIILLSVIAALFQIIISKQKSKELEL
jgi:uncharacterized membrane protein YtjA (UPF0391 family)